MRSISSLVPIAFCLSVVACDGGNSDPDAGLSLVVDSGPADAGPPPDAEPCPADECDGVCVDFNTAEQTCGDCTTACNGGESCMGGACACPDGFVVANPTMLMSQLVDQLPGTMAGFGGFLDASFTVDALVAAYPIAPNTPVVLDQAYPLVGGMDPPQLGAGYNVNIQTFEVDAAYQATEGTITFTAICGTGTSGGFRGTAANVKFQGVTSLTDPTIDPDGCSFIVPTVAFAFGTACP